MSEVSPIVKICSTSAVREVRGLGLTIRRSSKGSGRSHWIGHGSCAGARTVGRECSRTPRRGWSCPSGARSTVHRRACEGSSGGAPTGAWLPAARCRHRAARSTLPTRFSTRRFATGGASAAWAQRRMGARRAHQPRQQLPVLQRAPSGEASWRLGRAADPGKRRRRGTDLPRRSALHRRARASRSHLYHDHHARKVHDRRPHPTRRCPALLGTGQPWLSAPCIPAAAEFILTVHPDAASACSGARRVGWGA